MQLQLPEPVVAPAPTPVPAPAPAPSEEMAKLKAALEEIVKLKEESSALKEQLSKIEGMCHFLFSYPVGVLMHFLYILQTRIGNFTKQTLNLSKKIVPLKLG